jgi:hypothetical protein
MPAWFLDALLTGERVDAWQTFGPAMAVPGSLKVDGSGKAMGRTLAGTTVELVHRPDGVRVNNIPGRGRTDCQGHPQSLAFGERGPAGRTTGAERCRKAGDSLGQGDGDDVSS